MNDVKGRPCDFVERWCDSVIQFVRTRVAKRRYRLKNQELDSDAKTVLNIDVTLLLEKFRLEYVYNFGYFATMTLLERLMCFFCGLDVSKRIISLGLCGFAVIFQVLGQAPISDDVQ